MSMPRQPSTPIAEARKLASRFEANDIKSCLEQALQGMPNACYFNNDPGHVMDVLARAGFVRDLMQQGSPLSEAMRELGRRIRRMQETMAR